MLERAEARAAAERATEEQAERAARAAAAAGESMERRMAAAESVAAEASADTADAQRLARPPRTQTQTQEDAAAAPPGAVAGDGSAICPPEFPIKGNASSRIYHVPGQVSYPPTIAEFCFASTETAEAAGFRQSRARGQRAQK
ncbi:MAG: hypothetical protein H0V00_08985, partial [Chloroflexia bacterium]|nr:hypothetical protein [Chloroflexia bacterium]